VSEVDTVTVLRLAGEQGHAWVDPETAARIAAGAADAVAAVRAAMTQQQVPLFDTGHADFLSELERLAEPST
jgi:hypothetical protein